MSTCYQVPNVSRSKISYSNTRHWFCMNSALIPLMSILKQRKHFWICYLVFQGKWFKPRRFFIRTKENHEKKTTDKFDQWKICWRKKFLPNIRRQMYFKWSKGAFWNSGQLTLVVDWPNVKFSERNFCDFLKMLGKFHAFPMTR